LLRVNIETLTFKAILGILDFERKNKQKIVVDISFEYFFKNDGSNFIDYSEVASYVEQTMKKKPLEKEESPESCFIERSQFN